MSADLGVHRLHAQDIGGEDDDPGYTVNTMCYAEADTCLFVGYSIVGVAMYVSTPPIFSILPEMYRRDVRTRPWYKRARRYQRACPRV